MLSAFAHFVLQISVVFTSRAYFFNAGERDVFFHYSVADPLIAMIVRAVKLSAGALTASFPAAREGRVNRAVEHPVVSHLRETF